MKTIYHHIHFTWILPGLLLIGCDKEPAAMSSLRVEVVQNVSETRMAGEASQYEDDVLTVQLFVFDYRGRLEAEDYFSGSTGSVKVTEGAKKIHVLVNDGRISSPASEEALLSAVSRLEDNAEDRLIMVGDTDALVSGDENVIIRVRRLVSKISLGEIAADFAFGSAGSIRINSIFLTNVNSATTLAGSGEADPAEWYNRMGYSRSACDGILFESIGCTLKDGDSHKAWHSFYAYPNHISSDTHGGTDFCARYTRMVIDTDLGYYHIDFSDLSQNKAYIINKVTIKGPGGDTPEEHVERANCTFTITVKDWETGASVTEII